MELIPIRNKADQLTHASLSAGNLQTQENLQKPTENIYVHNPFIEANTKEVSLSCLKKDCIIPVFSKDNEKTIAHQEFIEIAQDAVNSEFSRRSIDLPEIRVSHQIKGRTPDAIYKPVKELLDVEKTQYFERMAFILRIPAITETINGNQLSLIVGGVRSYNQENLYSRKTYEKFKFFIGFQNMVCCNLCISTDGFKSEMRVGSYQELKQKISEVIQLYNTEKQLEKMSLLANHSLTETQFAQLIGRTRLYNHLSKKQKAKIPVLTFNDGQMNTIAKDYYQDEKFCRNKNGEINLWDVYNLFTSANKSSYIDTFLDRNVNAHDFTQTIAKTLNGDSDYHWFLS